MERWAGGSATQQNGGSIMGQVSEADTQASFPLGSLVLFLCEMFWMVLVEGGAGLLTSIFHNKIGGCLVCLRAEIMYSSCESITLQMFSWKRQKMKRWGNVLTVTVIAGFGISGIGCPTGVRGGEASLHQSLWASLQDLVSCWYQWVGRERFFGHESLNAWCKTVTTFSPLRVWCFRGYQGLKDVYLSLQLQLKWS